MVQVRVCCRACQVHNSIVRAQWSSGSVSLASVAITLSSRCQAPLAGRMSLIAFDFPDLAGDASIIGLSGPKPSPFGQPLW